MYVQELHLQNIGSFEDTKINFEPIRKKAPRVTVFIGNNGSGKTTILKSLVTALSWLPARIRTERGRGLDIPEDVISNKQSSGAVSIEAEIGDTEAKITTYSWTLSKAKSGRKNQFVTDLKSLNELADVHRTQLTENEQVDLPLLVFYPVERSVLDIPLKIKTKHKFEQLEAYDNALEMGVDFRRFFEWFRNEEDLENEQKVDFAKFIEELSLSENESVQCWIDEIKREHLEYQQNNKLPAVRHAIFYFTKLYGVRVRRSPLRMEVTKKNSQFNVSQLSQGEKSLMALVGDIARRLAMLNPSLENPLHGKGIVIIDEVDLHLHPQWQRVLIERLVKTFPNCQFILSTHSPLVISDSKDIVVHSLENGEITRLSSQYGQDANTVLLNAMDTAIRTEHITKEIDAVLDLIQDNRLDEARQKINELREELPENHLELTKAQLFLRKQESRNEKNR